MPRAQSEGMVRLARATLLVLLWFGAVSALAGAALGVAFNGAGVPLEYLEGTPFTSFVIPALILGVVVGGTQGLAAVLVQRWHARRWLAASIAGFGMIIWIVVELAITGYFWLQALYFALGVGEVLLVLVLLGVLSPAARVPSKGGSS